jgi:hypothetical protein
MPKLSSEIEGNKGIELVNNAVKIFEAANLTDDEAQHLQKLAYSIIEKTIFIILNLQSILLMIAFVSHFMLIYP